MSIAMPAGAEAVEAWARSLELPRGGYRRRVYPSDGSPHPAVEKAVATLLDARCRLPARRPCLLCGADTALFVIDDCDEVAVGYWSCGCAKAFPGGEAPAGLLDTMAALSYVTMTALAFEGAPAALLVLLDPRELPNHPLMGG